MKKIEFKTNVQTVFEAFGIDKTRFDRIFEISGQHVDKMIFDGEDAGKVLNDFLKAVNPVDEKELFLAACCFGDCHLQARLYERPEEFLAHALSEEPEFFGQTDAQA